MQSLVLVCLFVAALIEACQADQTISLDLKSTPDGQLFYVEAKFGKLGEEKAYNLLVSTTYFLTWIPSIKMNPMRGYIEKSADGRPFLANTGLEPGTSVFRPHWDRMQINSLVVENQQFAVLSDNKNHFLFGQQSQFDGMLGLSGYESAPEDASYLFKNLLQSARINKLMFSLYINNSITNVDTGEPKATLVLGGVDRRYYTGDINYAKLYENHSPLGSAFLKLNKTLIISGIHLDWHRVGQDTRITLELAQSQRTGSIDLYSPPALLRLDSTTKLFIGDQVILDRIHLDFIGARLVGSKNGLYIFPDCRLDNKPDIVFSLNGGMDITMTPDDYLLHSQIEGSNVCLSAFKPLDLRNDMHVHAVWVFGTRFLRKYYTIFDFENDVVGFAEPK